MEEIPTILKGEYEPDYQQQLNQSLRRLLSTNGWQLPQLTNAEVASIILSTFQPVLPAGTIWYNSTISKLQFIATQADPTLAVDATTETITSI